MFIEHECFILVKKIPGEDEIPLGMRGVVLMVYSQDDYEVEFVDDRGYNIGTQPTFTLKKDFMAKLPNNKSICETVSINHN
jgi:hypothetical protein